MNEKIKVFIEKHLVSLDENVEILDTDNIFELGYVNSLFAMNLLQFVENEFDIEIATEDIDLKNFSSIENIMKLIQKKQANQTT